MSGQSVVWLRFFKPVKGSEENLSTMCKECKEKIVFLGGTSNWMNHMRREHPSVDMESVESDDITSHSSGPKQTRLDFSVKNDPMKEKVTDLIARYIVGDTQSMSVIKFENRRNICAYFARKYEVSCRRTF